MIEKHHSNIQGQTLCRIDLQSLFNFEGPAPSMRYGGIAQLGEHLLCKQGVSGSIPLISTIDSLLRKESIRGLNDSKLRSHFRSDDLDKWAYSSAG